MASDIELAVEPHDDFVSRNVWELHTEQLTFGQRVADRLAEIAGSWAFIGGFGLVLFLWIGVNSLALLRPERFDPFPFILLNLVLSCLAAIQAPVIMMSQNRQETRDRLRAEQDYQVNLKAEQEVAHIQEELDSIRERQLLLLLELQQQQMEILNKILECQLPPPGGDGVST
jgi:uncharacterized membrane protein